jgi:hypothetical protein
VLTFGRPEIGVDMVELWSSQRVGSGFVRCKIGMSRSSATWLTSRRRNLLSIFWMMTGEASPVHVLDVKDRMTFEYVRDDHHAGHPQSVRARGTALPARPSQLTVTARVVA